MKAGAIAALVLAGVALVLPGPAADLRDRATDLLMQAVPREFSADPVLVVAVTQEDLAAYGPWPWPRERLARVLDAVAGAGPAGIALDLVLAERAEGTPALEAALSRSRAVVALVAGPSSAAAGMLGVAQMGAPDLTGLLHLSGVEPLVVAGGTGALATLPGETVRAVPLIARLGAGDGAALIPGLSLAVLARALALDSLLVRAGDAPIIQLGSRGVPLPANGLLRLDPAGERVGVISAGAVLQGQAAAARGRIVLLGVTAPEVAALRPSVLGPFTPSVLIHAEAAAQLAAGWIPRPLSASPLVEPAMALVLGLLTALLVRRRPGLGLGTAVLVALAWPGVALAALRFDEVLVDPVLPAVTVLAAGLAEAVAASLRLARERERLMSRFAHRLPTGVAEQLLARPEAERLRPELSRVAVVMTDLAGFSAMVRGCEPNAVITALNAYLAGVEAAVLAQGGMLERLIGDSVLAVFGTPVASPDDDRRALAAARAIDAFAEDFRRRPQAVALGWGETRIGVAAGEVLAGEVGGSRLTWAVCGDAANVSARLQELAKTLGLRALVTGIDDPSLGPPVGRFALRGLPGEAEVRPLAAVT